MIALAFLGFCISELVEARMDAKKARKQNGFVTYPADYSVNNIIHPDVLKASINCEKTPLIKRSSDSRRRQWRSLILKYMI